MILVCFLSEIAHNNSTHMAHGYQGWRKSARPNLEIANEDDRVG
jgi:hypothetical protein